MWKLGTHPEATGEATCIIKLIEDEMNGQTPTIEQPRFYSNINYNTPSLAKQNLRILCTLGRDKCLEDLRTKFFPAIFWKSALLRRKYKLHFSDNCNNVIYIFCYIKVNVKKCQLFKEKNAKKSMLLLIPLRGKQMVEGIR